MKRRFLALAMALVMVVGLLPASILTANAITIDVDDVKYDIQETPIDLSVLTLNGDKITKGTEDTDPLFTVTEVAIDSDSTESGGSQNYFDKKNFFTGTGEEFITQEIEILSMPIFGEGNYTVSNSRVANGYWMLVGKDSDGQADYEITMLSIYRVDEVGNLSLGVAVGGSFGNTLYPLGVKVGDPSFKLMAHFKEDGKLDVYCNDILKYSSTEPVEYTNSNAKASGVLRIGYNSTGAVAPESGVTSTNIKVYSLTKGTKVEHVCSGGTATCSTKANCSVCGAQYGDFGLHVPGKDGKCTLCQAEGFIDYTTSTLVETPINLSTTFGAAAGSALTVNTVTNTAVISQATAGDANSDAGSHYLTKKAQSSPGEKIFSQDIEILKMPVFNTYGVYQSRVANGYFMLVGNDPDGTSPYEVTMLSIYRVDDSLDLYLGVSNSDTYNSGALDSTLHPLGVEVGDRFKLLTVFKENGGLDVYCDGNLVFNSTESVEYTGTNNNLPNVLRIGYNSYNAVAPTGGDSAALINIYSVNTVTKQAHEHSGGKATCTNKAVCTGCGQEYGEADGLHTPGRNGKCTECGLGGFMDYVNYNVIETPINISEFETKYGEDLTVNGYTATISQDAFDATAGVSNKETGTHTISQKAFASPGEKIYSQDIEILKMPIFSTHTVYQSRSANGLYMLVGNDDGETPYEITIISIYRVDETGNLALGVADIANYNFRSPLYPLGKTVGQRFKLTTVFKEDGKLDVYCDGTLVCSTTEPVEHTNSTGDIANALRIGYSSYSATAPESGDTSTLIYIHSLNEVTMEAHVHAPVEDDFDCTTGYTCACGTEVPGEANHVRPEDDGNCATDIVCSNDGCNVVLEEGHTLTHVDRVEPDGATPGMKEHWYCATDDAYFLDEAGTQKVNREDLVISAVVDVEDGKATVKDEFADVVTGSEGQVELEVPTASGVELPAAVLDALQTKGQPLVITTSGGKVTLNQDFLAAIKNTTGESGSLFVEVKAGATLEAAQETELAKKGTVKEVISAEMLAGGADLHDFTGTVTIEIPFELAPNTTANDYQLWYVDDNGTSSKQIEATFADGKMTATLEHFSNYAIVTTATEPVQGNGTITQDGGSATATVTGTYVDGDSAGTTFSVAVEWGNLEFFYDAANTWNPETHTNDGGGWRAGQKGNVKVTNHSNVAVTVTVTKDDVDINGTNTNLGVDFVDVDGNTATGNLIAGPEGNPEGAQSFTVEFTPRGTLDETAADGITLATITVRIEKYDEEAQN